MPHIYLAGVTKLIQVFKDSPSLIVPVIIFGLLLYSCGSILLGLID